LPSGAAPAAGERVEGDRGEEQRGGERLGPRASASAARSFRGFCVRRPGGRRRETPVHEGGAVRAPRNLGPATLAFTLCFAAWSLISPFAKSFKHDLGLSYTEALLLTAVPVVLGSLLRIPVGMLTDRYGGRLMFSMLLAFSAVPAVLFGYADGYAS